MAGNIRESEHGNQSSHGMEHPSGLHFASAFRDVVLMNKKVHVNSVTGGLFPTPSQGLWNQFSMHRRFILNHRWSLSTHCVLGLSVCNCSAANEMESTT